MKVVFRKKPDNTTTRDRTVSDGAWAEAFWRLRKNKAAVVSLFIFCFICLACVFAPYLAASPYYQMFEGRRLETPSPDFIFGTDSFGRDMFSRILYGGRVTLRIAFISSVLGAVAGSVIGLLAGYFGRLADTVLSQVLDILATIPVYLLVIATEIAFGWGHGYFMYAMAVAMVPQFARLVRASVMDIMGCEYIEAARALGVSHFGIIFRHVLHNIASSLIIRFAGGFAEALLTCAVLGYLGIGYGSPHPEWGSLAGYGKTYFRAYPHLIIIPCMAITISVITINLFSDGLRDALDPRD